MAQHRPTGSETTPPYAPRSSRFGSEPPSVEDDVDVWRYAIVRVACQKRRRRRLKGLKSCNTRDLQPYWTVSENTVTYIYCEAKNAPFLFLQYFIKLHCILIIYTQTLRKFTTKLQQNAHLSCRLFSPYLVKRNISHMFITAVPGNICFKSHNSYRKTHHGKQCLLLAV